MVAALVQKIVAWETVGTSRGFDQTVNGFSQFMNPEYLASLALSHQASSFYHLRKFSIHGFLDLLLVFLRGFGGLRTSQ